MRLPRVRIAERVLVWFGVFGAPAAWVCQFLVGLTFTFAECFGSGMRRGLPVHGWAIAMTAAGAAGALAAWASAWAVHRATRDAPEAPPAGRVHFLATIGTVVSPLFLCIILMSGIGTVALDDCHQG